MNEFNFGEILLKVMDMFSPRQKIISIVDCDIYIKKDLILKKV
jgi:hypothetical protein